MRFRVNEVVPVNSQSIATKCDVRMASHIVGNELSKFSLVMFMVFKLSSKTRTEERHM